MPLLVGCLGASVVISQAVEECHGQPIKRMFENYNSRSDAEFGVTRLTSSSTTPIAA